MYGPSACWRRKRRPSWLRPTATTASAPAASGFSAAPWRASGSGSMIASAPRACGRPLHHPSDRVRGLRPHGPPPPANGGGVPTEGVGGGRPRIAAGSRFLLHPSPLWGGCRPEGTTGGGQQAPVRRFVQPHPPRCAWSPLPLRGRERRLQASDVRPELRGSCSIPPRQGRGDRPQAGGWGCTCAGGAP